MTGAGILGWMLIGSLFGFVAGVIAAAAFAVAHPIVLTLWEDYRRAKESNAHVNRILDEVEKKLKGQ